MTYGGTDVGGIGGTKVEKRCRIENIESSISIVSYETNLWVLIIFII